MFASEGGGGAGAGRACDAGAVAIVADAAGFGALSDPPQAPPAKSAASPIAIRVSGPDAMVRDLIPGV
jgi:hypothetical protein